MAQHLETRRQWRQQQQQQPEEDGVQDTEKQSQKKKEPKTWALVRDEFLGRVQLDLLQRELTKELILKELESECTFRPTISARAQRMALSGDFDERLRRDLERRRQRAEQYALLRDAIASAESTVKMGAARHAQVKGSFEDRLRRDLERRQQRLGTHNAKKTAAPSMVIASRRGRYY
ncbi:hypothetical protein PINS_up010089 [Pythium insidiosum]|nr:hypothetical protein PINS_up010089 [Pythium insidiosum]